MEEDRQIHHEQNNVADGYRDNDYSLLLWLYKGLDDEFLFTVRQTVDSHSALSMLNIALLLCV
ncbi:MAG: hypothetical protein C4K48_05350 [Candidatus Thorarchaeota archaeon]|nr:MAG: hypothetical protein C4K48_05350 [Candidatus Thorarchaeota archaeon]